MNRYVFRSPRLGFLAVNPALAAPAAAFYRRNRAAFAPFDPVQPEDFFTEVRLGQWSVADQEAYEAAQSSSDEG